MEEAKKQRVQEILNEMTQNGIVGGASILFLQDGKEEFYGQAGFADIAGGVPMQRDTICRIYSMTKPITGFAVMKLMEQGKLDLSDPVENYLPGFKNQQVDGVTLAPNERMTINHLLSMTSGLVYGDENTPLERATDQLFDEIIDKMETPAAFTTQMVANRLGMLPLAFKPGNSYQYGTGADVLGAIVEIIAEKPFDVFLKETLFEPLEMNDTDFFVPQEKQHRLAKAYDHDNRGLVEFTYSNLGVSNSMLHPPKFVSGGAGLVSTLDDYAKFATMLLQGGVYNGVRCLSEKTVTFFTRGQLQSNLNRAFWNCFPRKTGFSYGNLMRHCILPQECVVLADKGEYGWDGWLGTAFYNSPVANSTFLMMTQRSYAPQTDWINRIKNVLWS
ncbi:MAG: serine hydrolase [Oscillospiraceae bacterium]|nr:serine hydrolase [Oscillospiraceae bacterium]